MQEVSGSPHLGVLQYVYNFAGLCRDGDVRISGSTSSKYGAVEVCVNGTWGGICSEQWDNRDASVVCRQLGFSSYGSFSIYFSTCMHS